MTQEKVDKSIFPLDSFDKSIRLEGVEARKARALLCGVEIGTWADEVIKRFPRETMLQKPKAIGIDPNTPKELKKGKPNPHWPSYVVHWFYPDFDLVIARGYNSYPKTTVYAVQGIIIKKDLNDVDLKEAEERARQVEHRVFYGNRPDQSV